MKPQLMAALSIAATGRSFYRLKSGILNSDGGGEKRKLRRL